MEQEPAALPPPVIYMVQSKPQQSIRESYATRSATVLGCFLILGGLTLLIATAVRWWYVYNILASVFFVASGGLAVGGARRGSKCLVVATLVMNVISAVIAGSLLIISIIFLRFYPVFGLDIGVSVVMLVTATVLASLTCRPLCCRASLHPGFVQYTPDPAMPGQILPPAYQTVEGDGSKYQKLQEDMA